MQRYYGNQVWSRELLLEVIWTLEALFLKQNKYNGCCRILISISYNFLKSGDLQQLPLLFLKYQDIISIDKTEKMAGVGESWSIWKFIIVYKLTSLKTIWNVLVSKLCYHLKCLFFLWLWFIDLHPLRTHSLTVSYVLKQVCNKEIILMSGFNLNWLCKTQTETKRDY